MIWNELARALDAISRIDWFAIINASASVATVSIAYLAVKNWQRQDRAKREAEFLDALIEATYAYIAQMARPIGLVQMTRLRMMSYVPLYDERSDAEKIREGSVPYIVENGESDGKRIFDALSLARTEAIKLRSVSSKGQVFCFDGYKNCQNAISMLLWQFDRIEAFATIISSPTLNWNYPDVQRALDSILTVDDSDIHKHIQDNDVLVVGYVRDTYARLYGSRPRVR